MTEAIAPPSNGARRSSPLEWLLRRLSSIRLGVTLLTILFFYSSIGSAGLWLPASLNLLSLEGWLQIHVRQLRGFEMTEFEWFHWWPFDLLIALICLNLVVATLRRIPLRPVNYGVWMIHSGIIVLCIGSVVYFSTKVEGDTPVLRRQVVIEVPGYEPVTMPAIPGNRQVAGMGTDGYMLEVRSVDPRWELLSGDDEGKRAYSVTVHVQSAQGEFLRQLIAGYPQYTEDLIPSPEGPQPFTRAVKATGEPLVDDKLGLSLAYEPATHLYLANNIAKSWALYLRPRGAEQWIERPVHGLPLYNDYIASHGDVWLPAGEALDLDPLDVVVPPASDDDPLPQTDLRISSYLRYATWETRRHGGGELLDPAVSVRLENASGASERYDLVAFDPEASSAEQGRMRFIWAASPDQRARLGDQREAVLAVRVPGAGVSLDAPVQRTLRSDPDLGFTEVPGSDYAFRVRAVQDEFPVSGRIYSVAIVEIRRGEETFERWVFDDPALAVDRPVGADGGHEQRRALDESIEMIYRPPVRPAPVTVVAGPQPQDLGVLLALAGRDPIWHQVAVGEQVDLGDGVTLSVSSYEPFTITETRPAVIPVTQRDRDIRELNAMVKVNVALEPGAPPQSLWVPYHHYPFAGPNYTLRRYPYRPAVLELADGRAVEVILSRQRLPLPAPVVLDSFEYTAHVGGYSGSNTSILNWTSGLRFAGSDGGWGELRPVSVNAPVEDSGLWYFQSGWDPPMQPRFEGDPPSAGLNYTVLGVGSRRGVLIQLAGCIIAVLGMIYAFYVKPIIRQRRRQGVWAGAATLNGERDAAAEVPGERAAEPVGMEQRS